MPKKRKGVVGLQEALEKNWCYYCEREFNDALNLARHQKAKHFKCERCGRRLNTAGGLSVHMQQVHKETLQKVENALEHRQGLEVEIFGMEGIPEDLVSQRRERVIREFEAAAEAKRRLTGNPLPGMPVQRRPPITFETVDQLKARFRQWKQDQLNGGIASTAAPPSQPLPQAGNVFNQYGQQPFNNSAPGSFNQFSPTGGAPPGFVPPTGQFPSLPGYPSGSPQTQLPGPFNLPDATSLNNGNSKRLGSPPIDEPSAKRVNMDFASSVDTLIADARKAASATPTAEAGKSSVAQGKDKKRDIIINSLSWTLEDSGPEEMLAMHSNYAFQPVA